MTQFEELLSLCNVLSEDTTLALDTLKNDPSNQFQRRIFVHFLFALIEGVIFTRKRLALSVHEKLGTGNFCKEKLAWLKEETKGRTNKRFPKFKENLKFSFRACCEVLHIKYDLNLERDTRWSSFCKSITIRDRITHPRHVHDMTVSDKEMDHIEQAFYWFAEKNGDLQRLVHERIKAINQIL